MSRAREVHATRPRTSGRGREAIRFDTAIVACHRGVRRRGGNVLEAPRIAAAALLGCVTAGLGIAALASAATEAPRADVTLQVAPRGPGVISADPAGVDQDGQPVTQACDRNEGSDSCKWKFPAGTEVRLTAKPDGGKSFSGWSTPD